MIHPRGIPRALASILFLTLAVAGGVEGSPADTLLAHWQLARNSVQIGERVRLRAAVPTHGGARLLGPPAPLELGAVDIAASREAPAGQDSAAWLVEIAFFDLGEQDLGVLPFRLQGPEGEVPVVLRGCRVAVLPALADTATQASLRDIKGPVSLPLHWLWGRIALALGVVAAIVAAVFLWKRRPRPRPVPVFAPAISPEAAALLALRELEDEALPARGRIKEHYGRVSLILRGYVEDRFTFPAVEFTTDEIRRALGPPSAGPREPDVLLRVLEEADLVKFAKLDPGVGAAQEALARSRAWIERAAAPPAPGPEVPDAVR